MLILRSNTDSFDILLGSLYTQFSLAVAYFVTLTFQNWEPVLFKPDEEYWVTHDNWTYGQIETLFVLHIAIGLLTKVHEIKNDNTVLTGISLGVILIEATDVF